MPIWPSKASNRIISEPNWTSVINYIQSINKLNLSTVFYWMQQRSQDAQGSQDKVRNQQNKLN